MPLIVNAPVISTPAAVTLCLSVLFIKVFTSLEVPNVIYSWSAAVPILPSEEFRMEVVVVSAASIAITELVAVNPVPANSVATSAIASFA